jgi:2-keto-4-pentenoate hydratase/2-oxohepta-3-ene-1,7-dioic acid hydratase in catechol pathway
MSFVAIDGPSGPGGPDGLDGAMEAREIADHPFGSPSFTGRRWPLADVRLLAPILPSKVIGIGRNYHAHATELGNAVPDEPMVFLKPSTSVIGPGAAIAMPAVSHRVDYEGELAVVIGRPCHRVRAADARSVILGYTCANDVTARDLRAPNAPWLRSKGFDTFCPLGPWIETELDPSDVTVTTSVNGDVRQDGHTADLIFGLGELIEYCSAIMTLLPGDVILTGTPEGVGPLAAGDVVSVAISGIGELENPVVAE